MKNRFQQQVTEKESEIKGRVATVSGLKIDQNRPVLSQQNVLWTEISQHETIASSKCVVDQPQQW